MLGVVTLSVVILSVATLNVVMLNVMAPGRATDLIVLHIERSETPR
jgi:hypothetical protein